MELDDEEIARQYIRTVLKEVGYAGIYGPIPTFKRTGAAIDQLKGVAKAGVKQLGVNAVQIAGSIGLTAAAMFSPQKAETWRNSFRQEILKAEQKAFEQGKQAWKPVWEKFGVDGDAAILAMALAPQATLGLLAGKVTINALDVLTGGFLKEKFGEKFEKVKTQVFEPTQNLNNADLLTRIKMSDAASTIMRFISAYEGASQLIRKDSKLITVLDVEALANTVQGYMNLYTRTNLLIKDKTFRAELNEVERRLRSAAPGSPESKLLEGQYNEAVLNAYSEIIAKLGVAASEYDKQLAELKIRDPNIEKFKTDVKTALTTLTTQYTNVTNYIQKIRTTRKTLEDQVKQGAETQSTASTKPAQKAAPTTGTTPASQTEPTK